MSRPAQPQQTGHVVVYGDDSLALRLVEELRRLDERVVAVLPAGGDQVAHQVIALGAEVVIGVAPREQALRQAGVPAARAIAIVHEDDVGNLQAALAAEVLHPGLRIVLRMFNTSLGQPLGVAAAPRPDGGRRRSGGHPRLPGPHPAGHPAGALTPHRPNNQCQQQSVPNNQGTARNS